MALADSNDFEQWLTDRLDFSTGTPLSGDTGDMEQWLTDRLDFATYNEKEAGAAAVHRGPVAYFDGPTYF